MSERTKEMVTLFQETMQLPRDNGELVFQAPWEGRVFAMAVLMTEKGMCPWTAFNGKFVEEISEAERLSPGEEMVSSYYKHWMQAFEKLLMEKNIVSPDQLQMRTDEFADGRRHHIC